MSEELAEGPLVSRGPSHTPASEIIGSIAQLVTDAQAAHRALVAGAPAPGADSGELIHDYRVALRRLRSAMRMLRGSFGKRRIRALSDALRGAALLTSELRDEEVLRETLLELELGGEDGAALARWMEGRARRERGMRHRVLRSLEGEHATPHAIAPLLSELAELLTQAPQHELGDAAIAHTAVAQALGAIAERTLAASVDHSESMHRLRIAYKRLRYTLEVAGAFVAGDRERALKIATKMQKQLGRLHDLDEALLRMDRARGLPRQARLAVHAKLAKARASCAQKCLEAADKHGRELPELFSGQRD